MDNVRPTSPGESAFARDRFVVALQGIRYPAFDYYPRLQRVKDFVEPRLSEHISLRDAARAAAYETTYFCALFHKRVGMPFSRWLRTIRVSKAADLMRLQDHSIHDVARMVGFGSVRAFERAFKSVATISPSQYKKAIRPA